jgi:hypothetical protein
LNNITIKDRFPTEDIRPIGQTAGRRNLFNDESQVRLLANSTAQGRCVQNQFSAGEQLYEFVVIPFGPTNAPETFQTFMITTLGHLSLALVYLDDIIISSATEEAYGQHVREAMSKLAKR